jgi:Tol biopolymer transport system component
MKWAVAWLVSMVCVLGCSKSPEDPNNWLLYPSAYEYPIFMPDGKKIIFFRMKLTEFDRPGYQYDSDSTGLWEMDLDSSKFTMLYKCSDPLGLTVSPDGQWIVFSNGHIWKIKYNGSNPAFLTLGWYPSWSHNGTRIAYSRTDEYDSGLWVMNSDGSNQSKVIIDSSRSNSGAEPRWLKDDANLVYISINSGRPCLRIVHSGGGPSKSLYIGVGQYNILEGLAVSPSGDGIAFREGLHICTADWSDFKTKRVVSQEYCEEPSWSPDGRRIVYIGPDQTPATEGVGVIWIMDKDGSNRRQLTFNTGIN